MRFHFQAALAAGLSLGLASFATFAAPCAGFVDVDDGNATYCAAVAFLKDKNVTTGCSDATHFCPNDNVTRLQMALFMQRMARGSATNTLGGSAAVIGGGEYNETVAAYDIVGGGKSNHARGGFSTVVGGYNNFADGIASAVVGGQFNHASGNNSLAAGHNAVADSAYCAVLNFRSDFSRDMTCFGTTGVVRVAADHGMSVDFGTVRNDGGGLQWILLGDTLGDMISTSTGAKLTSGGAWTNASDRNSKADFAEVDALAVLDKVIAMPISTWRYKTEADQRHLGPMAQDFHAAFGLGADDRHITTVDAAGVAFAAIKGLDEKLAVTRDALDDARMENVALRERNDALERRLEAVERLVGR